MSVHIERAKRVCVYKKEGSMHIHTKKEIHARAYREKGKGRAYIYKRRVHSAHMEGA